MKMNLKTAAIVLSVILFNSGCLQRKAVVKDTFLLDARPDTRSVQKTSESTLAVQPFSIAPEFADKGIVSRTGDNQYESDFYNEYFISPASMITEQTRRWLTESGLSAQVLLPVSSVQAAHVLEGHIQRMVLDIRDAEKPRAEMEVTFFLMEQHKRNRAVRFQKTYSAVQSMESSSFEDYIAAQNRCLHDILTGFERDLAENL